MNRSTALIALVTLALAPAPAHAGFVVSVSDASIDTTIGTAATVDVRIRSDGPSVDLGSYHLDVRIELVSGSGALRFADPFADPQSGDFMSAAPSSRADYYVFYGNSGNVDIATALGEPLTFGAVEGVNRDRLVGGDAIANIEAPALVDADGFLLARLKVELTGPATNLTQFRVGIRVGSDTYFEDGTLSEATRQTPALGPNPNYYAFGTVTVSSPELNPVPAPAGLVLALTGLLPLAGWARWRRPRAGQPGV